jgi:PIN domain nuclease of toxin-antitoxin system
MKSLIYLAERVEKLLPVSSLSEEGLRELHANLADLDFELRQIRTDLEEKPA